MRKEFWEPFLEPEDYEYNFNYSNDDYIEDMLANIDIYDLEQTIGGC